jgi:hypothetical protein
MAYPHIHPISPGNDGWSVLYDTEMARILFHCGLRPSRLRYLSTGTVTSWAITEAAHRELLAFDSRQPAPRPMMKQIPKRFPNAKKQ